MKNNSDGSNYRMPADSRKVALKALKWREQPSRALAHKARQLHKRWKRAKRHTLAAIDLDLCPIPEVKLQKLKKVRQLGEVKCKCCGKVFPMKWTCSADCEVKFREYLWKKEKVLQFELEEYFRKIREYQAQTAWQFALSMENV